MQPIETYTEIDLRPNRNLRTSSPLRVEPFNRLNRKDSYSMNQSGMLKSFDNLNLFYEKAIPENSQAVLIGVHGLGEHLGRYKWLKEFLVENRIALYLYDQRGHGKSEGIRTHVESFEEYVSDLRQVYNLVVSENSNLPIFIFGHSMGAVIASLFVINDSSNLAGLILSSAAFRPVVSFLPIKLGLGKLLRQFAPKLRIPTGISSEQISHNSEASKNYSSDPLIQKSLTLQLAVDFFSASTFAQDNISELNLPILFQHGGKDSIADVEGARAVFEKCTSSDKTFWVYPELFHELHNESLKDRNQVFQQLLKWILLRN